LRFAGTVNIREFGAFSRCKSREGGYLVSYGRTLKLFGRRRLHGVYIYYVNGIPRQSLGVNMEIEYKILKFWAYYETAKFTWGQSYWLGKLANQVRIL